MDITVQVARCFAHPDHFFSQPSGRVDKAFNPNQPREPKGSPEGGQWTDAGLSYDETKHGLLVAGKRYSGDRKIPESEAAKAELLRGWLEHRKALFEEFQNQAYRPSMSNEEARAYYAHDDAVYAVRFNAVMELVGLIHDTSLQQNLAELIVKDQDALGLLGNPIARTWSAQVKDFIGNNLPANYAGVMNMFSPDYNRFAPTFINNWLWHGGSEAQYQSAQALKDFGPNASKQFWDGNKVGYGGIKLSDVQPGSFQRSENVAKNLPRLYDETQAFYANKFKGADLTAKTVKLYRGVGDVSYDSYKPWPMESWSLLPSTAKRFGKMMSRSGHYTVLTAEVPYSSIIMSYEAQKRHWMAERDLKGKRELVVLGGALTNVTAEEF